MGSFTDEEGGKLSTLEDKELPTIMNNRDWLNLHPGEQAVVSGKIETNKIGDLHILITFPWDWSSMVVDVTDLQGLDHVFPIGASIRLKVTRHHDGIGCVSKDIQETV